LAEEDDMSVHLQRDIEKLKRRLLALSTEVEEDVRLAIRALAGRDEALARKVMAREEQTNMPWRWTWRRTA
jgi:phosphate transport system protein